MSVRARCGAVLLEVIVGLAIVAVSGTALASAVGDALHREREMLRRERELIAMERVLAATSLLTGEELAQRLGERRVGEFLVVVSRPAPELYQVGVTAGARAGATLATLVYRPGTVFGP